jgi:hypothetical protein
MPDDHRPAMPQVTAVDDQFGTHKVRLVSVNATAAPGTAFGEQRCEYATVDYSTVFFPGAEWVVTSGFLALGLGRGGW